jgi:hypothetical protein
MQREINYVWGVRTSVLRAIGSFSNEQLNTVPPGFNNNLIWNLGHMIASHQYLFYIQTGIGLQIEPQFYHRFKYGSRPEDVISDDDIEQIKSLALSAISQFMADFKGGLFEGQPNIQDLLTHFIFHEGMHMAYILSIRRLLVFEG